MSGTEVVLSALLCIFPLNTHELVNCTLNEWVVDRGGGVEQVGVKWNANWLAAQRWPSMQGRFGC